MKGWRSMNAQLLLDALQKAKVYRGQTLYQYFGDLLFKSDAELNKEAANFLRIVATFVYRQFSQRRKGGVPLGHLSTFVLPESTKLDLARTMMLYIVRVLRKRGLREFDAARKSPTFDLLVRAYDQARR